MTIKTRAYVLIARLLRALAARPQRLLDWADRLDPLGRIAPPPP